MMNGIEQTEEDIELLSGNSILMLPDIDDEQIECSSAVMLSQRDKYVCSKYNSVSLDLSSLASCLEDIVLSVKGLGSASRCEADDFSPADHLHDDKYNKVSVQLNDAENAYGYLSEDKYTPGYRYPLLVDNSPEILGYYFLSG